VVRSNAHHRVIIKKTLSVRPAGNGYPVVFRAGKDEGGEEEEWHPT